MKIFFKRESFFFFVLLFCSTTFLKSQTCEGISLLSEDFNSGIPVSWSIYDVDNNPPTNSQAAKGFTGSFINYNFLGKKCVLVSNSATANDWLVSPMVTLGAGPYCLSWKSIATNNFYTESFEILVATGTSLVQAVSGTVVYSTASESSIWTEHSVDLSAYAGQSISIAIHYNSTGYALCFTDVRISKPVNDDLRMVSLDIDDVIFPSIQNISGKIYNGGLNNVSSFQIAWSVDGGAPFNSSFTTPVNSGAYSNFIHSINWNSTVGNSIGTHLIKIWTQLPNGNNDQNHLNDTIYKTVYVNNVSKIPLIEEYTQASCPPCGLKNPAFDSLVIPEQQAHHITLIKHQCAWPGYDPMNLDNPTEVAEKVTYYGIPFIPFGLIDGKAFPDTCNTYVGDIACFSQITMNNAAALPTIFKIDVTRTLNHPSIQVDVNVQALTDVGPNTFVLRTAFVEDPIIYANAPGSNNETDFHAVMRKYLPDVNGVSLPPMSAGQVFSQSFSYSYAALTAADTSTFKAVAFIQDDASQKVYQSGSTDIQPSIIGMKDIEKQNLMSVFPNPANNYCVMKKDLGESGVLKVYDASGRLMLQENVAAGSVYHTVHLNTFENGIYIMEFVDQHQQRFQSRFAVQK